MKSEIIRQGDVCLIPVKSLPDGATESAQPETHRIALAYGEVTGHAHAIYDHVREDGTVKARLWDVGAERFLQVLFPVTLKHEEHTHKEIQPGIYRLPKQMEYTPAELRRVQD